VVREVECVDAFEWLRKPVERQAVVTVLPDAAEVGMGIEGWTGWFTRAAALCFAAVPTPGPVVFIQTDRLYDGQWIDKAQLVASAAVWHALTWHKVSLRREVGTVDIHRPTFSHVLAYGGRPGRRTPDVIMSGHRLWKNGTDMNTARLVIGWLAEQGVTSVHNPFCGHGTLLAVANEHGLDAYGCDLDPGRAGIAQHQQLVLR
jgi:hypothetical protein